MNAGVSAKRIRIRVGGVQLEAELKPNKTAASVYAALPVTAPLNVWGEEFFCKVPGVKDFRETATTQVKVGDVAWWGPGEVLAIFFGRTPMSESGDGRDDPWLRFQPPADGVYAIRVQERFRARGGPDYAYRLRIAPPSLNDIQLRLVADAVTLPRGGQAKIRVLAETIVPAPVQLELDGLPTGVSAAPVTMAVNTTTAEFALKAEASARIDATRLTVRGTAKLGDQTLTRVATPLSVTLATELPLPRSDVPLIVTSVPICPLAGTT